MKAKLCCPWFAPGLGSMVVVTLCLLANPAHAFPTVTDVFPTFGPPGTSVAIGGSDLGTIQEVRFATTPAIFSIASPNLIYATVPLDATSGPLSVSGPSGVAVTRGEFVVPPRITDFVPESAPPGVVVLMDGANFEGATAVLFNATNALFEVTSPTQLQAVVPLSATSGPITVVTPIGVAISATAFRITGREPFVSSFTPVRGKPSDHVTIDGFNFTGATTVRFGGTNAAFSVVSPTQINATVPAGAPGGPLSVATLLGTNFSFTPFIVSTAPFITDFQPVGGPPGTPVVVNGGNFAGATAVKFGSQSAGFSVTAGTQLHVTVPTGATNSPITITTALGTGTSLEGFLATSRPIITGFTPTNGPVGTRVVLGGANFTGVQGVKVDGVNAAFTVTAPTQLTLLVPAGATNGPISVSSTAGTTSTLDPFLVRTGKPILTGVTPDAGPVRTTVVIEGLDLTGTTTVQFNGAPASFLAVADTQIRALVPDNATSGPITVTTRTGTVVTSRPFVVAPRLVSFSPLSGIAGTAVSIRGTNLAEVSAVRFHDARARIAAQSATELVTMVPDEATIGSISLLNPAGIVATINVFLVLPTVARFTPAAGQPGSQVNVFGTGFGDVTTVRFGGVDTSAFQVISPTQVVAVIPSRAVTGPISVTTISGSAASTRSFAIGLAVDLTLNLQGPTNSLLQSQMVTYSLAVTNQGPSSATSVVLSNLLPSTLWFLAGTTTQGRLTRTGSDVRVSIGTLSPGARALVTLTGLTTAPGTITNAAVVSALEFDLELGDNAAVQVATVLASPAVLNLEEVTPALLRFAWPVAATNFVLQSTDSLSTPKWQVANGTPLILGTNKSLTLTRTGRSQFYRLAIP